MRPLIYTMLLGLLGPIAVMGQDSHLHPRLLGIESTGSAGSIPHLDHWRDLIGDWLITFEELDREGAVLETYQGEWNFHYVLSGRAVQDVFFLPPRSVALDDETNRFSGSALRVFDPEIGAWVAAWADSNAQGLEHWVGVSVPGVITFYRFEGAKRVEVEYRIDEQGEFRWEQREGSAGGPIVVTQRVRGKRH